MRFTKLVPWICVAVALWLVIVPVGALIYTAFTADAVLGDTTLTLDNVVDAYSGWHILRLFGNSLIFAAGTAVLTLVMGGLVAWVVERTDAPGGTLFHALALLSFAVPGLLTAMAWIFVLSPNIGWVNALLKSAFGAENAPFNIYTLGGMIWALSSHYFPLAYLTLGLPPESPLAEAHARASEIEERIRRARPDVADVIVHTEP